MLERARQDSDHKCRKYFVWPSRGVRTRPGRRSAPDCSSLGGASGHSNIAATAESTYGRHRFTRLACRKRPTGRSYSTRWSNRAQPVANRPWQQSRGAKCPGLRARALMRRHRRALRLNDGYLAKSAFAFPCVGATPAISRQNCHHLGSCRCAS